MEPFEKSSYLTQFLNNCEQVICPELALVILDTQYQLLFATRTFKELVGIVGNYRHKALEEFNPRLNIIKADFLHNLELCLQQNKLVEFLMLFDFKEDKLELLLAKCKPIYFPNDEILGIKIVYHRYPMLDHKELLSKIFSNFDEAKFIKLHSPENNNLNSREINILFLLINGYTQFEIAEILDLPRGTIARLINNNIVNKLKIQGTSSRSIIDKAISLGYHLQIPKTIFAPKIVTLAEVNQVFTNTSKK